MDPKWYGVYEVEVETTYIQADPDKLLTTWCVWRIYRNGWFSTACQWARYYAWWWKQLLTKRRVPQVIIEIF